MSDAVTVFSGKTPSATGRSRWRSMRERVPPAAMRASGDDGLGWWTEIARPDPARQRLRLVVSSAGSLYYGDAATAFTARKEAGTDGF